MYLETLKLENFRCFASEGTEISMEDGLTVFVGTNGAGKTAVMQALMRLFGVTTAQRRVRLQDFHVPADEEIAPQQRELTIEAVLAFPELAKPDSRAGQTIPAFFHQMACNDDGTLKCRLRLGATWSDDGSIEGIVETEYVATTALDEEVDEEHIFQVKPLERARIQLIYVPATRDAATHVSAFLRGRLWRAIEWSQNVRDVLSEAGTVLNTAFTDEEPVSQVSKAVVNRWRELFTAGTDTTPVFRPIDLRLQEFIRKIEVVFQPDELGRDRSLEDLSDGQNSLFHIAMTAATLDIESQIRRGGTDGLPAENVPLPALTLLAIEEPENNLAPFYLSRIVGLVENVVDGPLAQAFISSHSASILGRVDPTRVRHFRLDDSTRSALIRQIVLPTRAEAANKYVREAVRAFPELYFARFVILGEGDSEEIVLPRMAQAMGIPIDRSFVAIVPLGGRHVEHFWKLLNELAIPHATLLDLDLGRSGGGWGRIKAICRQLIAIGESPNAVLEDDYDEENVETSLAVFDDKTLDGDSYDEMDAWLEHLQGFNVFYCDPLDLDWSMLTAFEKNYSALEAGQSGPSNRGNAARAVLGPEGDIDCYDEKDNDRFKWYRYLFLNRGKPSTHLRVLSSLRDRTLARAVPPELKALLETVATHIEPEQPPADAG